MAIQTVFEFSAPTRLIFGSGALNRLSTFIEPGDPLLIVTDAGIRVAGLLDKLTSVLDEVPLSYTIFDETEANPSAETVTRCAEQYKKEGCGGIVALGGGSSMDVAKGAGILATNGGRILEYEGMNKFSNPLPFLLCIPTTYGTGSEVTPFTVITDTDRHFKITVGSDYIFPDVAILDPDLAVQLPLSVAAATGMDALTHAIEAYVCLAGNVVTRALAIQAAELIVANLRQAAASDHNIEATGNMLIAATLAGRSFGYTRLGNAHAMAHPLGAQCGIPHGIANAVLLPYVMEYNLVACPEQYAKLAQAMGISGCGASPIDMARRAVTVVKSLSSDLEIPENLKALGVQKELFEPMTEDAMKSGNIPVNPRKTSHTDILRLFEKAYG
jgi:alcohol dehydrogenase